MADAHPHVVLPHLIALANGDRFAPGEETPPSIDRAQIDAAKELLKELRRTETTPPPPRKGAAGAGSADAASGGGGSVVQATELLYDFYLQLAWASRDATSKLCETARSAATGSSLPKLRELMAESKERKATVRARHRHATAAPLPRHRHATATPPLPHETAATCHRRSNQLPAARYGARTSYVSQDSCAGHNINMASALRQYCGAFS